MTMGTTIQPLVAEEVDHRLTMADLFQGSTLAQLKSAAELYRADADAQAKDYDPASAAQVLVEMGRRGEWSENALATREIRKLAEMYADATDRQLDILIDGWPGAGYTTNYTALRVHLLRAERWLRGHETRTERQRRLKVPS